MGRETSPPSGAFPVLAGGLAPMAGDAEALEVVELVLAAVLERDPVVGLPA